MALYCAKKLSTVTCNNVNMGCDRCDVCGHYHRALHLQAWGQELEVRILAHGAFMPIFAYFSPVEWTAILERINTQCGRGQGNQWVCSVVAYKQGANVVLPVNVNKK